MTIKRVSIGLAISIICIMLVLKVYPFIIHGDKESIDIPINSSNQEVLISGTLYKPKKTDRFPVTIIIHGDGPADRTNEDQYNIIINSLLDKGIGVYSYDKQGVGRSTGNWLNQTMKDRALEAIAVYNRIAEEKNVEKVGYLGFSQGGWVLAEIALEQEDMGFMIVVGGAIDWMEQGLFMEEQRYKAEELPEAEREKEYANNRQIDTFLLRDDYQAYQAFTNDVYNGDSLMSQERFHFIALNMTANATKGIYNMKSPFLGIFGSKDRHVDAEKVYKAYNTIFEDMGKENGTLLLFEGATHTMLEEEYGEIDQSLWLQLKYLWKNEEAFVNGYLETLGDWIIGQ